MSLAVTDPTVNGAGNDRGSYGMNVNVRAVAFASRSSSSLEPTVCISNASIITLAATIAHIRRRLAHVGVADRRVRRTTSETTATRSTGGPRTITRASGIQYHSMTIGPANSTIPVLIGGYSV